MQMAISAQFTVNLYHFLSSYQLSPLQLLFYGLKSPSVCGLVGICIDGGRHCLLVCSAFLRAGLLVILPLYRFNASLS